MKGSMELSDEDVVLMSWKVALRRGWLFVMDTLLRGGLDLFPPKIREELQGSPQEGQPAVLNISSLFTSQSDSESAMPSQESEDEGEEEVSLRGWSWPSGAEQMGQKKEWLIEKGCGPQDSTGTLISCERPPVPSEDRPCVGESPVHLRIERFIAEATRVFYDCFSSKEIPSITRDSAVFEPLGTESQHGLRGISSASGNEAQVQTPKLHLLPPVAKPPQALPPKVSTLRKQVVQIPAMPISHLGEGAFSCVLPSVAVIKPILLPTASAPEEFPWVVTLAAHVPKELREKVVALQFLDMFSLLPEWSNHKLDEQLQDSEEKSYNPAPIRTFKNWQIAFAIMGSILLEDAPDKMKGFFNYGETIRKAHEKAKVGGWLIYDEHFRRLKEVHPDMSWAMVHSQLWMQISTSALSRLETQNPPRDESKKHASQQKVTQGKTGTGTPETQTYNTQKDRALKSKKLCWQYNADACVKGILCCYTHRCSNCGRKHPKVKCLRLNPVAKEPVPTPLGAKLNFKRRLGGSCWLYNRGVCKKGKRCRFLHCCSSCGGSHLVMKCHKLNPAKEEPVLTTLETTPYPKGELTNGRCWDYDKGKCRKGNRCKYRHLCFNCRVQHPTLKCPKMEAMSLDIAVSKASEPPRKKSKKGYCWQYEDAGSLFFHSHHLCSTCGGEHPSVNCHKLDPKKP